MLKVYDLVGLHVACELDTPTLEIKLKIMQRYTSLPCSDTS